MRRRQLLLVPLLLALTVPFAVSACAESSGGSGPGGPVTPSSIPIDIGPSASVAGNTMPTGIVVDGKELVLFFWMASERPVFAQAVRDTATGAVSQDIGMCTGGTGSESQPPFLDLTQCVATDGSLIEFGAFRGEASRVTSQADGKITEAKFARWNKDVITVFWLRRQGKPAPGASFFPDRGMTSPGPAEQYPLVTIYSAKGKAIGSARIKPGVGVQKGG
ncbi:hypothetical protein [Dactylosporangium sp. NPDC049140]|jgi:hypothetical protein|uniref:hypothetical protein n=1 Tax=Dactylosporangium sp. NPDC049140 TaxID=3155647 RepID=UPI0033C12C26